MSTKEINVHIDLEEFNSQLEQQREQRLLDPAATKIKVRTSVFSLGQDPQLATVVVPKPANLRFIEILRDGLNNPYLQINWRILRTDVTEGQIVCFNIFRRKVSQEKFFSRIDRSGESLVKFTREEFERINRGSKRCGRFRPESVCLSRVNNELIPLILRNKNLATEQDRAKARYESSLDRPRFTISKGGTLTDATNQTNLITDEGSFLRSLSEKKVRKIGTVSYSSFIAKENRKSVSVFESDFVDMKFQDKSVRFGDTYEYYIVSVSKVLSKKMRSNSVTVHVEDSTPVKPPTQILAKQFDVDKVRISFCVDAADEISRSFILRRSEDDLNFKVIGSFINIRD